MQNSLSQYGKFYTKVGEIMNFDLDTQITIRIICDADYKHQSKLARVMFTLEDMIYMAGDVSCFVLDAERNLNELKLLFGQL